MLRRSNGLLGIAILISILVLRCGWAGEQPDAVQPAGNENMIGRENDADGKQGPEWFSDRGRAFAPLLADPREAQVRVGFIYDKHEDKFLDLGFGGDVGLLRDSTDDGRLFSLTVRGLMTARFQFFSESFDMYNTDFIGGPAAGFRYKATAFELFLYHQSSHLGDDKIANGEREAIDYSREAVRFLASHEFPGLRIYGGPTFNFRGEPDDLDKAFIMQGGAERPFRLLGREMYAAVDVQLREENDWDANLSAQIGMQLGNPAKVHHRQRVFIEYFTGHSNMGQYYDEHERYVMLGLGYNF